MFSYIHIPFCESKCSYCRFASIGNTQDKKIELYKKFLLSEIKTSSFAVDKNESLESIYFGGGTPSTFSPEQLGEVIYTLKNKYNISENIEVCLESTPNKVTSENIQKWGEVGFNRISIGVQSLNPQTLGEIGREDKGSILDALDILEKQTSPLNSLSLAGEGETKSGIFNISIDFIIGLPYVKKGGIVADLKYILEKYSCITHVSVYMLEEYYSQGEELGGDIDSKYDKVTYPTDWKNLGILEEDYLGEYLEVKKYLSSQGFERYEFSNFSKLGFECRHNQAYWNHSDVHAFGLGASGLVDKTRYTNSDQFLEYYKKKNIFSETLSQEDIFTESVMFGLRTKGISKNVYMSLDQTKITSLIGDGYLEYRGDRLCLADNGSVYLDYILQEIIV